jgi:hypothetical protein
MTVVNPFSSKILWGGSINTFRHYFEGMEISGSVPKPEGVLNTFGVCVGPALVMISPSGQCLFELSWKIANTDKCFVPPISARLQKGL